MSGEEEAGNIKNIGRADTLPTEGFLEAGDLFDCLKKDWRRPAALLLRLAILFRTFGHRKRDIFPLHTDINQSDALDIPHAESPGLPDGLGGR